MLLSIVVPFYNSMPYMKNLVESLINNSISAFRQEVEIIFVNDGSTDDYHEALKGLDEIFDIKIIDDTNPGTAHAKNLGLSSAEGKYVWFVDSDDVINDNAIKMMLEFLNKISFQADIVFSNFFVFDEAVSNIVYSSDYDYSKYLDETCEALSIDIVDILFSKLNMTLSIWYQIFNRRFLRDQNLLFDESLRISEDLDFKLKTLFSSRKIAFSNGCTYGYRLPSKLRNSLSTVMPAADDMLNIMQMELKWYRYLHKNYPFDAGRQYMKQRLAFLIFAHDKYLKTQLDAPALEDYLKEEIKSIIDDHNDSIQKTIEIYKSINKVG